MTIQLDSISTPKREEESALMKLINVLISYANFRDWIVSTFVGSEATPVMELIESSFI